MSTASITELRAGSCKYLIFKGLQLYSNRLTIDSTPYYSCT
jgi:hypothetical protein